MRTLAKPDLGIKRVCPSCGARFYDLQKRPIECPKCAFAFEPEALVKQRRPRVVETPPPQVKEAEAEEAEEVEETEAEPIAEPEEAVAEAEEEVAEAEVEKPGAEPAPAAGTGEPVEEFEDAAEEEEEQDDNLLEEVEEEEDDVSGIIDADIEKEEP